MGTAIFVASLGLLMVTVATYILLGSSKSKKGFWAIVLLVLGIIYLVASHALFYNLGAGNLRTDSDIKAGAIYEIVNTMKVEDKTVVAVGMPDGKIKYYELELPKDAKYFVKTDSKGNPYRAVSGP